MNFWTSLLDLLSPRRCVGCGQRLVEHEHVLCSSCMMHLPLTNYSRHSLDNPLARLFWGIFPIERASAFFFYEPQTLSAQLVHHLKYFGRSDIAEQVGQLLVEYMKRDGFFEQIDAIIPVPLTAERQQQRGYNQAEMIARGIGRTTGIPVRTDVMKRVNYIGSQTRLNAFERRKNVEGAFQLMDDSSLKEAHLLLVDDVITTGSTIINCASELARIPGVRISVVALGYAKN